MQTIINKLKSEHQVLYKDLEALLLEFTELKNARNDELLIKLSHKLLNYVNELLVGHFNEEELELFPDLFQNKIEIINRLIKDHQEIKSKTNSLKANLETFQQLQNSPEIASFDWQNSLLYPAYNLIATINHHALREDRELFEIT